MVESGKKPVASEAQEQAAVISWWRLAHKSYGVPEYTLLHIANEGTGSAARGRLQKRQGVRAGVADLFLSVPRGAFSGLWIEMKRQRDGYVRPQQKEFLSEMQRLGYDCAVCRGADAARQKIVAYMTAGVGRK